MAKRQKTKVFSFQGFDNAHYKTTAAYTRAVNALFDKATNDIADAASKEDYNPEKPFSFDDYPKAKARLQTTLKGLAKKMQAVIELGSRKQWLFACQKNDEFIASIFDITKLTKGRLKKMQDRNLDALQTFQQRKVGGMNLSERVWKYTQQYKEQIEIGLDVGLGEGRSAQQLSRDLRQNLQDPNRLFRRVRDKRGNLQLSKVAKAFHPGRGVYRSSYKNAMRLTRSEVNMAYREADHLRWQQLDFVVGFEIHRSNREPQFKCSLCDRLVGRYPKWFKFKGFHPQCMCYATAILMDEEDFDKQELSDLRSALKGTAYKKLSAKNEVTDLPDGFKEWVKENAPKQAGWATTPYFIKDNFIDGDLSKGLIYVPSAKPLTLLERATIRHQQRTPEQVQAIQERWEARKQKHAIDAFQNLISEARKMCAEWGISSSVIDNAISDRNPSAVEAVIVALNAEVEALRSDYNSFVLDATKTTREASRAGVDFTDVLNDLNTLIGNKAQWKLGQFLFRQRLQDLKNRIVLHTATTELDSIITGLDKAEVAYNEVKTLEKELSESDIVSRVGGGDLTNGSCSSLAFTYAGNKGGLDVLDFRDGKSRELFSRDSIIMRVAEKVGGAVIEEFNDYKAAGELLKQVSIGKEYYFACAAHAAIIRKTAKGYEYLELQSATSNGFKPLSNDILKRRFGAKRSRSHYGQKYRAKSCLIDIDLLNSSAGFRKLLGYINTNENEQRKGAMGMMK